MADTTKNPFDGADNLWVAPGESSVPEPRVRRVPAGGHFSSPSFDPLGPEATMGGAAAGRPHVAGAADADVDRPAGHRYVPAGEVAEPFMAPVQADPSTTMQFLSAWKASGHTDDEIEKIAASVKPAPAAASAAPDAPTPVAPSSSSPAPAQPCVPASERVPMPVSANGATVAMGRLAADAAALGASAEAVAAAAQPPRRSVSDLNLPSTSDSYARMAEASLWGPASDDAAVTAATPVNNPADPTGKLTNGSANMTAKSSSTAEFLAVASACGPRTQPSGADAVSPQAPVAAVSPQPVYPVRASSSITPPTDVRRANRSGASPYGGNGGSNGNGGKGKGGKGRSIASVILIIVGIALLAAAGFIFVRAQMGYKEAQATYADLQQYAVQDSAGDGIPQVDFDELEAINPDVIGWIYVPNTVINYPVVQTDNNTTYLTRLFDLSGNGSGSIFMDMDGTAPGAVDEQTTLYGHHMYDNTMFKIVDDTLKQDAFNQFGNVYYITRENTYVFKPMFTAQVMDTFTDARVTNFTGDKTLQQYLTEALGMAKAQAPDVEERIGSTDKVLSLITCAGEIIPRTTRAVMVCSLEETIPRQ